MPCSTPVLFRRARGLVVVAGLVVAASLATAQAPAPAAASDPMVGMPAVQSNAAGFRYLSGGAGSEERQAMDSRRREFPLKVVLSAGSGEYVVAETLSLVTPQGEVLVVRDAGPVVMIQAPAGAYTLVATYQGRTVRRAVPRGAAAQTLNLRFPR